MTDDLNDVFHETITALRNVRDKFTTEQFAQNKEALLLFAKWCDLTGEYRGRAAVTRFLKYMHRENAIFGSEKKDYSDVT